MVSLSPAFFAPVNPFLPFGEPHLPIVHCAICVGLTLPLAPGLGMSARAGQSEYQIPLITMIVPRLKCDSRQPMRENPTWEKVALTTQVAIW